MQSMTKTFKTVLKATGRNSYGLDGVKGAHMIEESGSVEKAPKKKKNEFLGREQDSQQQGKTRPQWCPI